MPQAVNIAKAYLVQIESKNETKDPANEIEASRIEVQFNPETLKVSYSNQISQPKDSSEGKDRKTAAVLAGTQFVGKGSTKLAVQLLFDVTGELSQANRDLAKGDVRKLTKKVIDLITPQSGESSEESLKIPPKVRFAWGSFRFEGILDSLEESLEFFSPQGQPLRASMSLSMVQQEIKPLEGLSKNQGSAASTPGTRPRTAAPAGSTVQGLAEGAGIANWQGVAQANNIENPRQLTPGTLLDLGLRR